jgi:hypothetical protein
MSNSDPTPPNENSLEAFTTLGQFLEADGWYPQRIEDKFVYRMGFAGQNGQQTCFATIFVDYQQLLFYAIAPVKAPETARPAVAEFITRANYGLRIGNMEMDFSDGEVRYKSSLDFEGETLTARLIKNTIYPAVQTLDRYLPGLMGVVYGAKSPAEAIADIEGAHE